MDTTNNPYVETWCGKKLDDMSKEELILAVQHMAYKLKEMHESHAETLKILKRG